MKIEPLNRVAIASIDFPFDQPTDYRLDGELATSFSTVRWHIDRARSLGFNAISFDTNVPINAQTGELQLLVPGDVNGNKSFPEAVWRGIEYAESVGLKTIIDLNIRNAYNDVAITKNSIGKNFDTNTFFESVKLFEGDIATKAQKYGVDGITIGSFNFGFADTAYRNKWNEVVSALRSVYSGTLRYESNIEDIDNPLWQLVDEIQICLNPTWHLKSNFTAEDIAPLYLGPYIDGNKNTTILSTHQILQQYFDKYPQKTLGLQVQFLPGQSAGHEFENPWGYVFEFDPLLVNAKDQNSLRIFPDSLIDKNLNNEKIRGFLEYFGNYLDDNISNLQFWQYMPWTEANWIREPHNHQAKVWQSVARANSTLNWNPEAEEAISRYISRDWGFTTLHYGTDKADQLTGSEVDDKFFGSKANDVINGGLGKDTVKYTGNLTSYTVSRSANSVSVDKPNSGRDVLTNIERLVFDDRAVAFDTDGIAGRGYRIYKAAFDRTPDTGGLGYWIKQMDQGMDMVEVAARFIDSAEFRTLYGQNPSNADFLSKVYNNVLDRNPDADGLAWWVNEMKTNPAKTWQKVLADFAESTENQANVASEIATGITFDPWLNVV